MKCEICYATVSPDDYRVHLDGHHARTVSPDNIEGWRADYKAAIEQRDAWKAAFDEVEGQRNSLVIEVGNLRRVIADYLAYAKNVAGNELPQYCDCGHRKAAHDGVGQCLVQGCDCMAMLDWRPR